MTSRRAAMKTIVITLPHFWDGEARHIARLLREGDVDGVHLRKPGCNAEELERLIEAVPEELRGRLVTHDHYELAMRHGLGGIHLNSRNGDVPKGWKGSVSRSCHSMEEVEEWKQRCDYVSLSPIFDSISKAGYLAAFTKEELREARMRGVIDHKVMALGGVTFARLQEVETMGFGGGMILGDAWKDVY